MSSRKAKKDGQEERNGIRNGPVEDSPVKPTAADAPFNIKQEVHTMSMNELNTTARDLMSVRAMIEELQAEAEALTDKLKAAMVEQGTESIQGDGWKATWKNVNSQRFDSKSFKAEHADLYAAYSKATTTTRFVLSV